MVRTYIVLMLMTKVTSRLLFLVLESLSSVLVLVLVPSVLVPSLRSLETAEVTLMYYMTTFALFVKTVCMKAPG